MESKNTTLERSIEHYFVNECKRAGWWCVKFLPFSLNGMPDRVVLMPGAKAVWVELKRPGAKPRKLQLKMHGRLRAYGFEVHTISSREGVNIFTNSYACKDTTPGRSS